MEAAGVTGEGLLLRPWREDDVSVMTELFDTDEMDRWTPLAHPFTTEVARRYVAAAQRAVNSGLLQYAITVDGEVPLGEVLLFPTDEPACCEFAYAVGAAHRGARLAARAMTALRPMAVSLGYGSARLRIAVGNTASEVVARAAGFQRTDEPLLQRERKGYRLQMATWRRSL
ncbi:MAG: GNAT family N-acetyltransferase [Actinomycetes bacterium]